MESYSILVVEDEALIAMSIEMTLQRYGFQVAGILATGEEAIDLVRISPPDLALLDINCAGKINGIETARLIQDIADIPIIFLTGYSHEDLRLKAMEVNPAGYFVKPISFASLITAIKMALEKPAQ